MPQDGEQDEITDEDDTKRGYISIWRYFEESEDISCIASTYINEPVPFKDMNFYAGMSNECRYLHRSHTGEIFWFSINAHQNLELQVL